MPFQFRESFQLQAPADRVWEYLADPRQVVTCLPGAELISAEDANTYRGLVKVKVGPVTATYDGTVTMLERDDRRQVVRMRGEGRDTGGSGSASMTMTSAVVALPGGTTQVDVAADIELVGRIVQFGRGMIDAVNRQLFMQFTACVAATLERPSAPGAQAPAGETPMTPTTMRNTPAPRPLNLFSLIWQVVGARLRLLFRPRPARP